MKMDTLVVKPPITNLYMYSVTCMHICRIGTYVDCLIRYISMYTHLFYVFSIASTESVNFVTLSASGFEGQTLILDIERRGRRRTALVVNVTTMSIASRLYASGMYI